MERMKLIGWRQISETGAYIGLIVILLLSPSTTVVLLAALFFVVVGAWKDYKDQISRRVEGVVHHAITLVFGFITWDWLLMMQELYWINSLTAIVVGAFYFVGAKQAYLWMLPWTFVSLGLGAIQTNAMEHWGKGEVIPLYATCLSAVIVGFLHSVRHLFKVSPIA